MGLPVITIQNLIHNSEAVWGLFFKYDDKLIQEVKKLEGRKWSASKRCWYIPFSETSLEQVMKQFSKFAQLEVMEPDEKTRQLMRKLKVPKAKTQGYLNKFSQYLFGQRYSKSTINTYTYLIKDFLIYWEEKDLKDLNNRDVESYCENVLAKESYSISTHRQFVGALKKFMERFPEIRVEVLAINLPKNSFILPNVLSKEEIIHLLQATINLKHRTALAMLYSCGLRIGELLRLEIADIDFARRQVKISQSKGRKDRYVVLADSVVPLLKNYLNSVQPRKYLIEGEPGKPYSPESVRQFLHRSCKAAGIKKRVTPHTLRHSYATHLMESGIGQRYIQELLGHKSIKTTMIYTHVAKKSLTDVRSPLDDAVMELQAAKNNKKLPNKTL
jgi:site-specific recombinase XerD